MLSFKGFLREQVEGDQEGRKIKHLTHVEDRPLQTGKEGMDHAVSTLKNAAEHIKSGKKSSELTTKYDGSPALVYGHHPESGKFFVASKSAFNANPKVNYTSADIDANHGHAPGLAAKLKDALKHLPKIAPKKGVYQGDMMFGTDKEDKKHEKGGVSFHPNPSGLTYTAHGDKSKQAKEAKIGVVTHLKYEGNSSKSLAASHDVDHENFNQHKDVFTVDPQADTSKVHFSKDQQAEFNKHINAANKIHATKSSEKMYAATNKHQGEGGHLESYINHTVRTGEQPNSKNFNKFIEDKHNTAIEKLKSDKGKDKKKAELADHLSHIKKNTQHYDNLLQMHNHLQKAKNVLVGVLNQHQDFEHTHHGEKANAEGYVFHNNGESDKLVNRDEFSRRNFAGIRNI